MASGEQLELSNYIKSVHEELRNQAKTYGAEKAWLKHNEAEEKLQKYAQAMKTLSTKYWETHSKSDPKVVSRIDWVYKFCCGYFEKGGFKCYREKEEQVAAKSGTGIQYNFCEELFKPYRLLDVGSCYDPFGMFSEFKTVAIDIAPAVPQVYKCDFLKVPISTENVFFNSRNELVFLPENYFHIVVFSLVLEYLPSSDQRLLSCKKAYNLLKPEGLLFIVTPDSKHVGANFKIMKTWRYLLAELGFSRIKYEKLAHIHCMAFRKSLHCGVTQRWTKLHKDHNFYNAFVIPQDFKETIITDNQKAIVRTRPTYDVQLLQELPFCDF